MTTAVAPSANAPLSVETAVKAAGITAAVLYALGLITVNVYLRRLAVAEFDLLHARFVLTGVLVIAFSALAYGFLRLALWVISADADDSAGRRPILRMLADEVGRPVLRTIMFSILLGVPLFLAVSGGVHSELDPALTAALHLPSRGLEGLLLAGLATASPLVAGMALFGATGQGGWLIPRRAQDIVRGGRDSGVRALLFAALAVLLALVYIDLFARLLYPAVPEHYGGGQPVEARLVFTEDGLPTAEALNVPIDASGQSEPVEIVFRGTEWFVLRIDEAQTLVHIDKESIAAMSVVPD